MPRKFNLSFEKRMTKVIADKNKVMRKSLSFKKLTRAVNKNAENKMKIKSEKMAAKIFLENASA